jgi:hypothetical protein
MEFTLILYTISNLDELCFHKNDSDFSHFSMYLISSLD